MPADHDRDFDDAVATVRRTLEHVQSADPKERDEMVREWSSLTDMARKLETGRVDIALFGEVSSGKSALINALVGEYVADVDVRGGWTKEIGRVGWGIPHAVKGLGTSELNLIDTPGINEVDDQGRAILARNAAASADLILFVTDADLNAREFEALTDLATNNKPIILVFNKKDLYTPEQRLRILDVLRSERLPHVIGPDDIVMTAADPLERETVFESPDGSTRTEWRKPKADVEELKVRILNVLDREGKALIALNASLFAADTSDKLAATKIRLRDAHAQKAIWTFVVAKSVAVAANPVPLLDVGGGLVVDTTMVVTLGDIYGLPMSKNNAGKLIRQVIFSAGWVTLGEWMTHMIANAMKATSFGAATVATAVPQGLAGGYGSYIVGQAAKYYLQHGASWGDAGPKTVVRRILETAEEDSILEKLRDEVSRKLRPST
ncbi:MAG TPA: GTP-binding protein [Bryobacteraceae bacterium]|nr:GTP-binding protein [Bryobacteraceae bacterium]